MRLFIFDIDGTLANTLGTDDRCFRDTIEAEFSIQVHDDVWEDAKKLTSGTDSGIFYYLFKEAKHRDPSIDELKFMKTCFFKRLCNDLEESPEKYLEIPGAKRFFNLILNNTGNAISIATGCWRFSAILKLKALGIKYENIVLSCADEYLLRKDLVNNAILEAQKRYLVKSFNLITYFGDGEWDFEAAKALGINFIGIDFKENGVLRKLGVDFVYKNFIELIEKNDSPYL